MKCLTCKHPLNAIAPDTHWCLRCGSIQIYCADIVQTWPPDLVKRVREFSRSLDAEQVDVIEALRTSGVMECIGDQ